MCRGSFQGVVAIRGGVIDDVWRVEYELSSVEGCRYGSVCCRGMLTSSASAPRILP